MQPTERLAVYRRWLSAHDDLNFQRGRKLFRDRRPQPADEDSAEWLGFMLERAGGILMKQWTRELLGVPDED